MSSFSSFHEINENNAKSSQKLSLLKNNVINHDNPIKSINKTPLTINKTRKALGELSHAKLNIQRQDTSSIQRQPLKSNNNNNTKSINKSKIKLIINTNHNNNNKNENIEEMLCSSSSINVDSDIYDITTASKKNKNIIFDDENMNVINKFPRSPGPIPFFVDTKNNDDLDIIDDNHIPIINNIVSKKNKISSSSSKENIASSLNDINSIPLTELSFEADNGIIPLDF